MNKKMFAGLAVSLILPLPFWANAGTLSLSEAAIRAKITALLAEVSALQSKLDAVKTAEKTDRISKTFHLIEVLAQGTRSDDVKMLQTLLASESEIYPEGYVTGYYGKLTIAAVERFKNKHPKPEVRVESIAVPQIFGIAATSTNTTMTVTWKTNAPTSAKIWWGSPGPLDPLRMTPISTSALAEDHQAVFSGTMYASTTYAFIIAVSDKDGNTSTTTEQIYVTP